MKTVKINLPQNSYDIYVGLKSLRYIPAYLNKLNLFKKGVVITDRNVDKYYSQELIKSLKENHYDIHKYMVKPGEQSKSLKTAEAIYHFLHDKGLERKSFIIALGGGVVGDLAGFVASTYKRGIPLLQVPTSLLAQVDSSIGGKVAVNIRHGKNFVGAFYQPQIVLINPSVLKTLPKKEMSNGLAEIIKYGIIKDKKLFADLEQNMEKIFQYNEKFLEKIIARSCQIKADVVQKDEKEENLREILNFGHTIGHSLEEIYKYKTISHGAAVAIGMIAAAVISQSRKKIKKETAIRITMLIKKALLPTTFRKDLKGKIIDFLKYDKKVKQGKNKFVLLESLGRVSFGNEVTNEEVKKALEKMLS